MGEFDFDFSAKNIDFYTERWNIHFIFSSERCYFQLKSANSKNILTFDFTMWNSHGLSNSRGKILKSFISPRSGSRRDKVAGKFRFQKIFDQSFGTKLLFSALASDWIWIWNLTKLHDLELTALHRAGLKGNKSEYFGSCFPWKQKWSQKQS